MIFFGIPCTQLALTGVTGVTKGPKRPLKGPCTPKGPLRTLSEANTGNPSDLWAILDQTKMTKRTLKVVHNSLSL